MACPRPTKYPLILALVLVAGCGSSPRKPATTKTHVNAPVPTNPVSSPLDAWLVQGTEEPGYVVASRVLGNTVQQVSQGPAETATLTRYGFRRALIEHLNPSNAASPGAGLSLVIEFGSPPEARRAQAYELRLTKAAQGPGSVITRFTVAGVPGAEGFTAKAKGPGAANVVFTEGSCVLLIGDLEAPGSLTAPLRHAALAVYRRTHGACP